MWITVHDPALLDELRATLARANCHVERADGNALEVGSPSPLLTDEQASREILFYLAAWRVRHPDVEIDVFE
jgi:hypothetical protein